VGQNLNAVVGILAKACQHHSESCGLPGLYLVLAGLNVIDDGLEDQLVSLEKAIRVVDWRWLPGDLERLG